ncbi:MAG: glycosyltransferase family 2 protein [Kiritimatiellaeota bacterium]|nr:glycosyltransferase family 2 protein [Kiritimatiellota bacterium]
MSISGRKVVVVMPAYNAEQTLRATLEDIPADLVDHTILVDDASADGTARLSRELGLETIVHPANRGYGANQKTCYRAALERGADIVAMLHPDYQYTPRLLRAMCSMVAEADYDLVLGSRILVGSALEGGMPLYKYVSNRFLTLFENLCLGCKLSEYHTGYRVFNRRILEAIDFDKFSDDFIFDNQMLAEAILRSFRIGEISCPARYFADASSISFSRSCRYGLGVLGVSLNGLRRRLTRRTASNSPPPQTAEPKEEPS